MHGELERSIGRDAARAGIERHVSRAGHDRLADRRANLDSMIMTNMSEGAGSS